MAFRVKGSTRVFTQDFGGRLLGGSGVLVSSYFTDL